MRRYLYQRRAKCCCGQRQPHRTCAHTLATQMKNWLPFVPGPALAMLSTPAPVCLSVKFSSSNLARSSRSREPQSDELGPPGWAPNSGVWEPGRAAAGGMGR